MQEWCISHDEKIRPGCKLFVYSRLYKSLISRIFVPDGKVVRKYALVLGGGEQKTQTGKVQDT